MIREPGAFIRADCPFIPDYKEENPAPMFRRRFMLGRFVKAEISVCALGLGEFYINGMPMTADRHITPTSDYNKTLWYSRYDVTSLLREGANLIACILGNGWYNETMQTDWHFEQASWRDSPKFALTLYVDGKPVLTTDEQWKCSPESWITFNQLRSGEHADLRLYEDRWNTPFYDDGEWAYAVKDDTPPKGVYREAVCPPVRFCTAYPAKTVRRTGEKRWLFDIGQNISGVARVRVRQKVGDVLTIRYAEQINDDGELLLNNMTGCYECGRFMTDEVILSEEPADYAARFTYHGFRYVEIDGLEQASADMVEGLFLHADVEQLGSFECSDETLNRLFRIGVPACYSNMYNILTDCPTREKLGWLNDARASSAQLLMNFDTVRFFKKWYRDILDSVREDGAIPGIAPTWGWGYDRLTGPICTSVIHEVPYQVYRFGGDASLLIEGLPYILKHIEYLKTRKNAEGFVEYGLYDWAGPFRTEIGWEAPTPAAFTDTALYLEFLDRAMFAARIARRYDCIPALETEYQAVSALFKAKYLKPDGTCVIHEQTTVAMIIMLDLFENLEPLAEQLHRCMAEKDYHISCGMLGIQFLFPALRRCGLTDDGVRMLMKRDFPSFGQWLPQDATTLFETFYPGESKNHHMWSCFMLFLMDTLAGIVVESPSQVLIRPDFAESLRWCRASRQMENGLLEVYWHRNGGSVRLCVTVPEGVSCIYGDTLLNPGLNKFIIQE